MAEFVRLRMELMLPEFEQLKRIKLMDTWELDKIKKEHEKYEYKIARQTKRLNDYLKYINYEKTLLLFIQERRNSRKIYAKKGNIEGKMFSKIINLYTKALTRFPEDISTWDSFIKFYKTSKNPQRVSAIFDRFLRYHGDKPESWLKAAMFEWKELKNIRKAVSFLSRGIQRHPKCSELYILYIKTELNESVNLSTEMLLNDGLYSAQSLALKRVEAIYDQLKAEDLHTIETLNVINEIVQEYEHAAHIHQLILNDLKVFDIKVNKS